MKEFKDIPAYTNYQVSNIGDVVNIKTGMVLKPWKSKGYNTVELRKNGVRKTFKVHQLVAMAFLGHVPDGYNSHVRHLDDNKLNNNVKNIKVGSIRDNMHDKPIVGASKYRGVKWHKKGNLWQSKISIKGRQISLGYFKDEWRASVAYQFALFQLDKLTLLNS